MLKKTLALFTLLAVALSFAGCGGRKAWPDLNPGWHSPDYSTVLGRLQRVPSKNPENPPLWIIRYAYSDTDKYSGKFNVTPPVKLTGFNGGELVQITGVIRPEYSHPEFAGTWYEIQTIRIWNSHASK